MGLVAAGLAQGQLDQRPFDFFEGRSAFGDGERREPAAVGKLLPTGRRR